jgi:hypothetical protein
MKISPLPVTRRVPLAVSGAPVQKKVKPLIPSGKPAV